MFKSNKRIRYKRIFRPQIIYVIFSFNKGKDNFGFMRYEWENTCYEYDEYDLFSPFSIAIKTMDNNEDPLILTIEYLLILMSFSGEGIDFNKFTIDEFNKNKLQNIYCKRTYDMDITFSKEEKIYLIKTLIEQFEGAKGINLKSKEPFYIL